MLSARLLVVDGKKCECFTEDAQEASSCTAFYKTSYESGELSQAYTISYNTRSSPLTYFLYSNR